MQTQKPVKLTILIPTYNEEDSLPVCLESLSVFISEQAYCIETIFIDSGSTDNSIKILELAARDFSWLKIIRERKRNGVGSAFQLGIKESKGQLIAHYETDCPFELNKLNLAIEKLDKEPHQFIMGIRRGLRLSILRKVYTAGYRWYIYLLFGIYLQTINFGYKIYPSELVSQHNFFSNGWFFDAELLIHANSKNLNICEVPIDHRVRVNGLSHVGIRDVVWIITEALMFYVQKYSKSFKGHPESSQNH